MTEASSSSPHPAPHPDGLSMLEKRRIEAEILKEVYLTLKESHGDEVAKKTIAESVRREVKAGLDPGLAVVRFVYDSMRIDAEWSILEERGFTWWGHRLAQHVWADEGHDDMGIVVFRVHARTAVLHGLTDESRACEALDEANRDGAPSALVLHAESGEVESAASMWVHADTVGWVSRLFAAVASLQVADAHAIVDRLASSVGATIAASTHPVSGTRRAPDEMLGVHRVFAAASGDRSAWAGQDVVDTLDMMRGAPMTVSASGDETRLTGELLFGGSTIHLRVTTDELHPTLGHGIWVQVAVPHARGGAEPREACDLNLRELASMTGAHALGSWVATEGALTHVAFFPNLTRMFGSGILNLVMSETARAKWVARELDSDDREQPGRLEQAQRDSGGWQSGAVPSPLAGAAAQMPPVEVAVDVRVAKILARYTTDLGLSTIAAGADQSIRTELSRYVLAFGQAIRDAQGPIGVLRLEPGPDVMVIATLAGQLRIGQLDPDLVGPLADFIAACRRANEELVERARRDGMTDRLWTISVPG